MTNADIEKMLTVINKTVNTLSLVTSDIDLLLGCSHTFIAGRETYIVKYLWFTPYKYIVQYLWSNQYNLDISVDLYLNVTAVYYHPLLLGPDGFPIMLRTSLNAPDINSELLYYVGQCCHQPPRNL